MLRDRRADRRIQTPRAFDRFELRRTRSILADLLWLPRLWLVLIGGAVARATAGVLCGALSLPPGWAGVATIATLCGLAIGLPTTFSRDHGTASLLGVALRRDAGGIAPLPVAARVVAAVFVVALAAVLVAAVVERPIHPREIDDLGADVFAVAIEGSLLLVVLRRPVWEGRRREWLVDRVRRGRRRRGSVRRRRA